MLTIETFKGFIGYGKNNPLSFTGFICISLSFDSG